jgi:hypothetical protein
MLKFLSIISLITFSLELRILIKESESFCFDYYFPKNTVKINK